MISNGPNFSGAVWQPYAAETAWALTAGDGWKTVYVKTRDALGRTVVAQDSIYFGATLPRPTVVRRRQSFLELASGSSTSTPAGRRCSSAWIGSAMTAIPTLRPAASPIEDAAAIGGAALRLSNGGVATIWTGGYLATLPATAYFRVKVSDNTTTQEVVRLRVMGATGDVGQRVLRGADFAAADSYQEFAVPYTPWQRGVPR